jgi:glycopeptide antibiotics resistance protein
MTTGVSVVIICAIELLQLFTLTGVCDVDDLILNMTGVLIGYIAYRIVSLAKG